MMDIQDTYTLRGICMLMIIVHHVIKLMPDCPMTIWRWGDLGTAVFFFISGWGLYCSMEKREKVDFGYLWQNLKKLLVPFFIVWAVIEIAYQIIHPEIGWSGFGKIWFIQVITGAYVVSILTFMAFRQRLLRLSLVALICSLYIYIAWRVLHLPGYRWCSSICFPFGMWLSAYREDLRNVLSRKLAIAVIAAVIYVLFVNYDFLPMPRSIKYEPAFCLMTVSLISIFNIQSKLLYFIGKNSLLFYLIHIAVLILLEESNFIGNRYILTLGVTLVATLALCWVYTKVENLIKMKA